MALALCCAGPASAARVAPRSAVVGATDVAGLKVSSSSAAPWLRLVSRHAVAGSHASASVLRSSGSPKLLIISRAVVAPSAARAKTFKQALGAASKSAVNAADAQSLGVRASALRGVRRIVWRDGPVVGELVTVGAAKGDAMVARLQDIVRARVRRTIDQSAWDALQARVAARGGHADAATAVQAFSLAVAPLPGVRVPKGPKGSIPEGTLAVSWMLANYGRLTPGVRQAFDKVVRRAFGLSGHPAAAGAKLDAIEAQAATFVGQKAGVDLTLPISIVRGYPSSGRGAAALGVDAAGKYRSSQPAARCVISVRANASRTLIAHEVFHCLQVQLAGRADALPSLDGGRAWLGEGSASYAGCLFSQDGAAPYKRAYAGYLEQPTTPLNARTYDAVGFFAHLDQIGAGALATVNAAMSAPSMAAAYPALINEGGSDIFGSWASSLYRTPARGAAWDVSGACAPARTHAADPTPIVVSGKAPITLAAAAYAAHPYELFTGHSARGAITVHRVSGSVRVGASGLDAPLTRDTVFCLGGGSSTVNPAVALSGGEDGAKVAITLSTSSQLCGPLSGASCKTLCLPSSANAQNSIQPPATLPPSPLGPHANRIAEENAKPGTSPSIWDIPGAGSPDIQGFTTDISYDLGQTVTLKIQTKATRYRLDIYRMGYYQGNGARRVDRIEMNGPSNLGVDCMTNGYPGLVDCDNWAQSATWQIPADAVSGIYFAHLVGEEGTTGESHVFFVVRDDASTSDIYYQTSDTTWQAYNTYGGESLYSGGPLATPGGFPSRAAAVSYNRPFKTRDPGAGTTHDWIFNAEYPMVRWLERNGYDVSYETGVDTDRYGALIKQHKVFMSTGHDEYWSGQQRANVESARDVGVNLAFFSGNEVFWKTRWDNDHRTLVCYKTTHDPVGSADPAPGAPWTGSWRDPAADNVQSGVRPENELTGQYFTVNGGTTAIQVPGTYRNQPFWRNTAVASLPANGSLTLAAGSLGYEWDSDSQAGLPAAATQPAGRFRPPAGLTELSATSSAGVSDLQTIQDYGHLYAGTATVTHHMTLYRAPSGALVFGAGTVQWSWGLDANHDELPDPPENPTMQQATVNLFADMGARPLALQPRLLPG